MEYPKSWGSWKQERRLGSGGFGEVNLWINTRDRQKVAIKFCKLFDQDDPKQKERWMKEVEYHNAIRHPNIVQRVEIKEQEFLTFLTKLAPLPPLIMEYCEKGDLRKLLDRHLNGLPELEVRNILRALRNAISYLHSKTITHRDLKPENVVIKEERGVDVYKITDLGYARAIGSSTMEATHVGTFEYFAPEVLTNEGYSNTIDYWSMGIVAFEVICGSRPFPAGRSTIDYIRNIKNKRNEHIAITENFVTNEAFKYHTKLFDQIHLSPCLKKMLEQWLKLPLSVNPHERGGRATRDADQPIFLELDQILDTKILTVFCLHNCRLFSYKITENTSREYFDSQLSRETEIPMDRLFLIVPTENALVNSISSQTKPIDFYITDLSDKPMLYCTQIEDIVKGSRPVACSDVVLKMLETTTVTSKSHALKFGKDLIFVVRQQCNLCKTFLCGLENYAMLINDVIIKFQQKVDELQAKYWKLQGCVILLLNQLQHARLMLEQKNPNDHSVKQFIEKIKTNIAVINERFQNIQKLFDPSKHRFFSALRRSHRILSDLKSYSNSIDEKSEISKFEILFKNLCLCGADNRELYAKKMVQCFYDFQESPIFLRSLEIENIQKTISEVHIEFDLIEKLINGLIIQEDETVRFINQFGTDFNDMLWDTASAIASNIPNLESIMGSLKLDSEKMDYSYCNGDLMDESGDMVSMVLESQQLIDEAQKLQDECVSID